MHGSKLERVVYKNYPRNEDTSLIRGFLAVPRVSTIERFHCTRVYKLVKDSRVIF